MHLIHVNLDGRWSRPSLVVITCWASSLVGARIRPIGPSSGRSSFWSIICTSSGQRNAAVLPEPVRAIPSANRTQRSVRNYLQPNQFVENVQTEKYWPYRKLCNHLNVERDSYKFFAKFEKSRWRLTHRSEKVSIFSLSLPGRQKFCEQILEILQQHG